MKPKGSYTVEEIGDGLSKAGVCYYRTSLSEADEPHYTLYICDNHTNCIDSLEFDLIPVGCGYYRILYCDEYKLLTSVVYDFRVEESFYKQPPVWGSLDDYLEYIGKG